MEQCIRDQTWILSVLMDLTVKDFQQKIVQYSKQWVKGKHKLKLYPYTLSICSKMTLWSISSNSKTLWFRETSLANKEIRQSYHQDLINLYFNLKFTQYQNSKDQIPQYHQARRISFNDPDKEDTNQFSRSLMALGETIFNLLRITLTSF